MPISTVFLGDNVDAAIYAPPNDRQDKMGNSRMIYGDAALAHRRKHRQMHSTYLNMEMLQAQVVVVGFADPV
jgi:hypothetical protein